MDTSYDDAKVLVDPQSADFITPAVHWPDGWSRTYFSKTGILEVTMDLAAFADEFEKAREESCGPASFCHWNAAAGTSGECRCAPQQYDANGQLTPIGFPCDNSSNVCSWSSYRSECPSGGCFGFQVAFPVGFHADDSTVPDGKSSYKPLHRPNLDEPFPASWDVKWRKAPNELSYDKGVYWDNRFYPFPGPCDYSNKDPDNAPLPSSVSVESADD